MTIIVNSNSTLVVPSTGLTLTAESTIAAGGTLLFPNGGTISGGFNLVNDGDISNADPDGHDLTIDTAGFVNQGTVVSLFSPLTVLSSVFTNSGTVENSYKYSAITVGSSVNFTNLVGGTLTGGTWDIFGGFHLMDGTISTLDAALNFWYVWGAFEAGPGGTGTQTIANTITEVGNRGILTLEGSLAAPGPLTIDGELVVSIGDLSAAGGVTVSSTGTLVADGIATIASPLILNGVLVLDPRADLQLEGDVSGNGTIQTNSSVSDSGTLTFVSSGTFAPTATLQGSRLAAKVSPVAGNSPASGIETIADPSGIFGSFLIENQAAISIMGTLELVDATTASVTFNGAPTGADCGELILDQPTGFTGTIVGFNNDSTIVLKGIIGNTASLINGTTLSILNGTAPVFQINLRPNSYQASVYLGHSQYQNELFFQQYGQLVSTATPDYSNNTTTITASGIQNSITPLSFGVPCFRAGTWINTPDGPVAVERISPGDLVISHFGAERRVIWIGHRETDCRRHPDPRSVWPVRISPDAFAAGQPHGELFLSPDHAVFVDGVLIPVRLLINGTTIQPIETSRVTWYHVELEEHDVIFAEGLAVESFLDRDDRAFFTNGGVAVQLIPNFTARMWEMAGCAPLVMTGVKLSQVRTMLEKRARGRTSLEANNLCADGSVLTVKCTRVRHGPT